MWTRQEIGHEQTLAQAWQSQYSSDEINKRLDQYLNLIPNGEVLQTSTRDPITHVWQDGKVVRHLDNSAVAIAADAEFAKSTSRRWLWLLLVITGMVCVTAFWVRHQSRGQA